MAELNDYIDQSPMALDTMGSGALNVLSRVPVIGGLFEDEQNKRRQLQDVQLQKYLQDSQNEFTERMYHENRDYMSEPEQMKRMLAAGLTPAAAAEALSGGNSGVSQPTSSGSGSVTPMSQYIASSAEAAKDKVTMELLKSQKIQQDILNSKLPAMQQAQIDKLIAEAKKAEEDGKQTAEQTRQQIELFDTLKGIKQAELQQLQQLVANEAENFKLIQEQIKTQQTQQYVNSQTGQLLGQEAKTEEQRTKTERGKAKSARYQAVVDKLRAGLANAGINPDQSSWSSLLQGIGSGNVDCVHIMQNVLGQASKVLGSEPVKGAAFEALKTNPFTSSTGVLLDYIFNH